MAQIRQSRPDSSLAFQVNILIMATVLSASRSATGSEILHSDSISLHAACVGGVGLIGVRVLGA